MQTPRQNEIRAAVRACANPLIAAALFSGAVNLLYLASPLYLTQIYNRVLVSGSVPTLAMLTLALGLALITMAALDALRARLLVRISTRIDRILSSRVLLAAVDRAALTGRGERGGQALRDLDQVRTVIASPAIHVLFDAPWLPVYLALLFVIDPLLGGVALGGAVALLTLAVLNETTTRPAFSRANDSAARSYAFTDAIARNADVAAAMGMTAGLQRRWNLDRSEMLRDQTSASERSSTLTAAIRFLRLGLQAAMLGVGAWLAIGQAISPVTIFVASIIMARALAPVEQAATAWRQFGGAAEAARRIRTLLAEAPPATPRTRLPAPDGRLNLRKVGYVLPGTRRVILREIGFDVAAGEGVGVIGQSGAGKSTLARLLIGAARPSAGTVRLGGADLAHWDRADLGRHIGYLPQDVGLFAGSVRDNIARFGDATDAEVVLAAERAGVHEMILTLPEGYETLLSEGGAGLSGGQRQRVGLARALLGAPRLIVLDEPNAHLDAEGERALLGALAELKANGATVIIVSHRPSAISVVDRLIVVGNGTIELQGGRAEVVESLRRRNVRPVVEAG